MEQTLLLPVPHDPHDWPYLGQYKIQSKRPPLLSGIYAIFGSTLDQYLNKELPTLYYVGESKHICKRLLNHERYGLLNWDKDMYHVTVHYIEIGNRKEIERDLIKILRPPLNIQHNG